MSDIVERLTEHAEQAHECGSLGWRDTMNEAADEITRLTARVKELEVALEAINRLAIGASVASCECGTKTPDITFHAPGCRYVLLQYIIGQCEDALAAITKGERNE